MTSSEIATVLTGWREVLVLLFVLHCAILSLLLAVRTAAPAPHRTPTSPDRTPESGGFARLTTELRERSDLSRVLPLAAIVRAGTADPELLTQLSSDPAVPLRLAATRSAGMAMTAFGRERTDSPAARSVVAAGAVDREPRVRIEACRGLGHAQADWALPLLLERLRDADANVREAAAAALGQLRHGDAVVPLASALNGATPPLARVIAAALRRIGGPVPGTLVERKRGGQASTRSSALRAIGAMGATELASHVASSLDDPEPSVRRETARVLGELASSSSRPLVGSPVVARLTERLARESDPVVLATIAGALARTADPSASAPLLAQIPRTSPVVREQLVEALALLERLIGSPS